VESADCMGLTDLIGSDGVIASAGVIFSLYISEVIRHTVMILL